MSKRKQWISLMLLISLLITIGAGAESSLLTGTNNHDVLLGWRTIFSGRDLPHS